MEYVFNMVCKLVNIILVAVDGAEYLLLKVTPPVSDISWLGSLAILMLISTFLLIKRGYDKFKLAPVFIILMLSVQSYNFFPKVEYTSLGGSDGIILSYRGEKILIHNVENDLITAARNSNITRIIAYSEDEIELNAGTHCRVKVMPSEKNTKMINLEIDAFSNKTILTRNTEEFMDVDLTKYDIIRVPKQKYYPFKGIVTNKLPKLTYSVVFSKVYSMNRE
jgi:competence protein ComEC